MVYILKKHDCGLLSTPINLNSIKLKNLVSMVISLKFFTPYQKLVFILKKHDYGLWKEDYTSNMFFFLSNSKCKTYNFLNCLNLSWGLELPVLCMPHNISILVIEYLISFFLDWYQYWKGYNAVRTLIVYYILEINMFIEFCYI